MYDDARRFEIGTLPYQDLAGFCTSVEMLLDIGIDCIASHVTALIDRMMARLGDAGAAVVTPADRARRAGILTVRANHAERVSDRLANAGIVCGLREGAIRVSPHFYTTPEDIDRAMEVLVGEG